MEGEVRAQQDIQPWVEDLSTSDRAAYKQARAEEIEDWRNRTITLLEEHLGKTTLDLGKLDEIAGVIGN